MRDSASRTLFCEGGARLQGDHQHKFHEEGQEYNTMNVAALAMSEPHVSTIISSVRAFDPTSIPLLTNIKSGRLS